MHDSSVPAGSGRGTVITVNRPIQVTAAWPERRPLHIRALREFSGVARVHLDVARRLSNPLLSGPPVCDELVAFVQHLLTEEEAGVMRHLWPMRGRRAGAVARAEHRPVDEVEPILRRLADVKRCIVASGRDHARRYQLMPLIPGIFEMVLIGVTPDRFNDWHQRFIELFEALYGSGYLADYRGQQPAVRFLPQSGVGTWAGAKVGRWESDPPSPPLVKGGKGGRGVHDGGRAEGGGGARPPDWQPTAMPTSAFEEVAERFKVFAVGQCQCRMAMNALGKGCGRALGNCTLMGTWAEASIKSGVVRQVSRGEILDIKRQAEADGMVSWVLNVDSTAGQASCSCCGCCCHAMKMISEFNIPGWFAPPRLRPKFEAARCTGCGACARRCPMKALVMQKTGQPPGYLRERCVGCGLCVLACPKKGVEMRKSEYSRPPFANWPSMLARSLPDQLRVAWKVWRRRAKGIS